MNSTHQAEFSLKKDDSAEDESPPIVKKCRSNKVAEDRQSRERRSVASEKSNGLPTLKRTRQANNASTNSGCNGNSNSSNSNGPNASLYRLESPSGSSTAVSSSGKDGKRVRFSIPLFNFLFTF